MLARTIIIALIVMLAGCQTTFVKPPREVAVRDEYRAGKFNVPLPPGEWVVAGSRLYVNNLNTDMVDVLLASRDAGKSGDMVWIRTNLVTGYRPGASGWVENSTCKRTNMLYVKVYANTAKEAQDCWLINHRRLNMSNWKNQAFKEGRLYLRMNDIWPPANTVDVRFFFANDEDLLHVTYFFNPDSRGIKPPVYASWSASDWHIDRIDAHPDKRKFATELENWGKLWYPKLKANFGKAIN